MNSQMNFLFIYFLLNRSSASDFVSSIACNLWSVQSHDTVLYFSKTLLMLLMDDEQEIRERNTETVMKLWSSNGGTKVVPIYAQKRFIEFLATRLINFDQHDRMALILLIVVDGSDGDNSLDVNIAEYRVFDKNEVNIFGETFIVKQMCLSMLKKLVNLASKVEEILSIVEATRKFSDRGNEATLRCFLENLL